MDEFINTPDNHIGRSTRRFLKPGLVGIDIALRKIADLLIQILYRNFQLLCYYWVR
jgi:hypothetical protein